MLTEQTKINSVSVDVANAEICVLSETQILRDGEVISSIQSKRFFNESEAPEFALVVPGAGDYIAAVGWAV